MMHQPASDQQAASASAADRPGGGSAGAAIDVEQLAEKVYQLLCQEVRLSVARGQRGTGRPLRRGR
ncbi:hypothetical protein [Thermogemmatispora tikiterensis]|uniref:Uncharacterized protein n=1 Tax=Thermogemmatispora tikiterensis TaxID=1825093 RepID=A0A328VHT8_9CHLR|nr:hypothetical protein [Thermogemmatispora tikiterensis]RAQ97518.1 hypothetical protein A4R35_18420 [Thermogemmatispora tikiterensis]